MCFVVEEQIADAVISHLNMHFKNEMQLGIINAISCRMKHSVINIVLGKTMQHHPGVAARLFSACAAQDINIVAVAQVLFWL
jgi:aspartokinase